MMKTNNYLYAIAAFAVTLLAACSSEDFSQEGQLADTTVRFCLTDEITSMTRADIGGDDETAVTTTFMENDEAGLYVVSNGTVIYENVKLTKNEYGFWEPETLIPASELTGVQLYAYYPYTEVATFDASANKPFQTMVDARIPRTDQQDSHDFENSDIMVTEASTLNVTDNTVNLVLKHQKALVYIELPFEAYKITNTDADGTIMAPYALHSSSDAVFTMNGETIKPYWHASSLSYRFIVEPNTDNNIAVTYKYFDDQNDGTAKKASLSGVNIARGSYTRYTIDNGVQYIGNWTLEVGDLYCSNGKLAKTMAEVEEGAEVRGIVYRIGTTDSIKAANARWSHAVVLGLSEYKNEKWYSEGATPEYEEGIGWFYKHDVSDVPSWRSEWRNWHTKYGFNPVPQTTVTRDDGTSGSVPDEALMADDGYESSQKWMNLTSLTIAGVTKPAVDNFLSFIKTYSDNNKLPANINTGWYVPSLQDWRYIEGETSTLSTQLDNVGGTKTRWMASATSNDRYWSSSIRSYSSIWVYRGNKTINARSNPRYAGLSCGGSQSSSGAWQESGKAYYRFIFAF
jgi:hypothetical protein